MLGEPYARDPRFVAQKAERHLVQSGIADVAYFGPEAEFFVFDHIAYEQREHRAFYEIDSAEGFWNTGRPAGTSPNLAYKLRQKEGYFPVPPADSLANLRSEMVATMESLGIRCEFHHHEVSSGGQGEIDMRFQPLLKMADQMMIYKYVVKNTAAAAGKTATFMPKPIFEENGSGMHVHQSLWKDGEPLMYGQGGYAHLSDLAKHYIGGPADARAGAAGVLRADDELVPPARARLRGAGQPRLLGAQPLGLRAGADVPRGAEDQADRVPLARPDRESVPRVQRADARRARRDQAPARPGRAARRRHLRAARGDAGEDRHGPVVAGGLAGCARGRPRVPDRRATCSPAG